MARWKKGKDVVRRTDNDVHPMDRWLRQHLGSLHDEMLHQPLPPELEDLARKLEEKLRTAPSDDDPETSG